jgi:hypothetical protein
MVLGDKILGLGWEPPMGPGKQHDVEEGKSNDTRCTDGDNEQEWNDQGR